MENKKYSLIDSKEIKGIINQMAISIIDNYPKLKNICFIGIIKRGDIIANRVQRIIKRKTGITIPFGKIDINLYRDDLSTKNYYPIIEYTDIPFDINKKIVFLFDDVFFTGRTIRSALNEIVDFGRPSKILLYVLIDRKNKELPIVPDFSGIEMKIPKKQIVNVYLKEIDKKDEILLIKEDN